MPRESVGDVLRKVHQWLRPGGMLVNIQPLGKPMDLGLIVGSGRRPEAGIVLDNARTQEDMKSSHRTLVGLAAEGLFNRRDESAYLLEYHLSSADDWQEFLARPKAGSVEADPELIASTLAHPDGRIVLTEETTITTWDRAG